MDNFHVYEEIGRGPGSVVYKGRQKATIEYVAVKSVDKKMMPQVRTEVYMLHEFDHENTLKFFNWFATDRHVWLILEYCTGGDLSLLLSQDKHLPEDAIKVFGVDLIAGLQYVHSCGVICCDLKPSNVLIDEYGVLKLCGFGLSTRVPAMPAGDDGDAAPRGALSYSAPELFMSGAVHSFASDLWSLGCLLYELRVGRPPFHGGTEIELVNKIQRGRVPLPPPDSDRAFSATFASLVLGLLDKDPRDRLKWADVLAHPFWNVAPPPKRLDLPDEPGFAAYCAALPSGSRPAEPELRVHDASASSDSATASSRIVRDSREPAGAGAGLTRSLPPEKLVVHSADIAVRPIVANGAIEAIKPPPLPASLPFEILRSDKVVSMEKAGRLEHLARVYRALADAPPFKTKMGLLSYCIHLASDSVLANDIVSSSLMKLFIHMLERARDSNPALRARVALAMGISIRHASFITPTLAEGRIMSVLRDGVFDGDIAVRRKSIAVLGELLFYIGTQDAPQQNSGTVPAVWKAPGWCAALLHKCLERGEDSIVSHYAAKALENILAQSATLCPRLATPEIASSLLELADEGKSEGLRTTCASALVHLIRGALNLRSVLQLDPGREHLRYIGEALRTPSTASQLAAVNMINLLFLDNDEKLATTRVNLLASPARLYLWPLMRQAERVAGGTLVDILPAKCLLALCLLIRADAQLARSRPVLTHLSTERHLPNLLSKILARFSEKDRSADTRQQASVNVYTERCFHVLFETVASQTSSIVTFISDLIDDYQTRSTNRTADRLNTMAAPFGIFVPLLSNQVIDEEVGSKLIVLLARCLQLQFAVKPGRTDEFLATSLVVAEALAQHPETVVRHDVVVVDRLLPSFVAGLRHESGDRRVQSLTLLSSTLGAILDWPGAAVGASADDNDRGARDTSSGTHMIAQVLQESVVPELVVLLRDRDPIPQYAMRLMLRIVEWSPSFVANLSAAGVLDLLPALLPASTESSGFSAAPIALLARIIESGAVPVEELLETDFPARTLHAVSAAARRQEWESVRLLCDMMYELLFTARDRTRSPPRTSGVRTTLPSSTRSKLEALAVWLRAVPAVCRVITEAAEVMAEDRNRGFVEVDPRRLVSDITRWLLLMSQSYGTMFHDAIASGRHPVLLELTRVFALLPLACQLRIMRILRQAAVATHSAREIIQTDSHFVAAVTAFARRGLNAASAAGDASGSIPSGAESTARGLLAALDGDS